MDETKASVSRRGFLVNLGKLAAGAAAGATALTFVANKEGTAKAAPSEGHQCSILGAPFRQLDLDAVEAQGYTSFKRGLYSCDLTHRL